MGEANSIHLEEIHEGFHGGRLVRADLVGPDHERLPVDEPLLHESPHSERRMRRHVSPCLFRRAIDPVDLPPVDLLHADGPTAAPAAGRLDAQAGTSTLRSLRINKTQRRSNRRESPLRASEACRGAKALQTPRRRRRHGGGDDRGCTGQCGRIGGSPEEEGRMWGGKLWSAQSGKLNAVGRGEEDAEGGSNFCSPSTTSTGGRGRS